MRRNRKRYQGTQCSVTSQHFKTPRQGYRLADISYVNIRRPVFVLLLPVLIGNSLLMYFFSELLYGDEILIGLITVTVLGGTSFCIGAICLTGFSVSGIATFGWYWHMAQLKQDLDEALNKSSHSGSPRGAYRR